MISSYSGKQANCIDVTEVISSYSSNGASCVAVGDSFRNGTDSQGRPFEIHIKDTDYPGFIMCSRESFKAFIDGVKDGEFDHFVNDGVRADTARNG